MSILSRITGALFGGEITRQANERANLAVRALDDPRDQSYSSGTYPRDRYSFNRQDILKDALDAWRSNALARRIVELTSQYTVGGGVSVNAEHLRTHEFLQEFWNHRLNRLPIRLYEWCDELTRSGEIFVVISTDAGGMSYVRAIPAAQIEDVITETNDIEQELAFLEQPTELGKDPKIWNAYDARIDVPNDDGQFVPVMLHYAINKPVGAKRGESDLAPLLKWLKRYDAWLEDRVRLNHFRQLFVFWVKKAFSNDAERLQRQNEINANPPNPGTVLVTNDDETWDVLHPKLDSFEANQDGLAIKKQIAAGSGNPLHFLAEPESSTRTTAEQAGGPTFRHYEQRQIYFLWCVKDICEIVARRRAQVDRQVSANSKITAAVGIQVCGRGR